MSLPMRYRLWGAATAALVINVGRQGIIFIPVLFILKVAMGMNGLVWAQPMTDVVSLVIAYALYMNTSKKMGILHCRCMAAE